MTIGGIATLPTRTDESVGTTKFDDGRPVAHPEEEIFASEWNAAMDALVGACEEVGEHASPAPGSLRYRMADAESDVTALQVRAALLEAGSIPVNNIQTFASTPGSIAATTALCRVTYAGGTTALDVSALPVGGRVQIVKGNASAYGITVVGDGNDTINGGSAGAPMTLPASTTPCSSTTPDPVWTVYRDSSTEIRVLGSASPVVPGTVLWEWNRTDVSQFEASAILDSSWGGSAPTLTVVPNSAYAGGKVLRFDGHGRNSSGCIAWLANQTLSTLNYRIEIEIAAENNGPGATYRGPLYWAVISGGSLYGYGVGTNTGTCWPNRIDAGVVSSGGGTPNIGGSNSYPRLNTLEINGGDVSGPGPRFAAYMSGYGASGVPWSSVIDQTCNGNASAVPGGWTGLTPNRFGLFMQAASGGCGYVDISRMRVIQL